MVAKSTQGLISGLTKGDAVKTQLTATAVSNESPTRITCANSLSTGDLVYCADTGFEELDGWWWLVLAADPSGFLLYGTDTTNSTGVLATGAMESIDSDTQMVYPCFSSVRVNIADPGELDLSTYCTPNAAIPATPRRGGTIALSGYVDIDDEAYDELVNADIDQIERVLVLEVPSNGYLVAPLRISTLTWDLPIDGATGFNSSAVLSAKMRHTFP